MIRQTCAVVVALAGLAFAAPASAQVIDGALRLHTETLVFGYQSNTETVEDADEGETSSTVSIGPGAYGLGFGLGFGIADNLLVGGNVVLQNATFNPEDGDSNSILLVSLLPYIELVLGEGSTRPFVGGNVQLQVLSLENSSTTMFGLGGLGGVHIFLADSFSFDVSGRLYFSVGSRTTDTPAGDIDTSITEIGLLVLVGVSGWSV